MKRTILLTILLLAASAIPALAQNDYSSSRLEGFADDLKRATSDVADRASNDLRNNSSLSRETIEAAFLATQLDASAGLFQDMLNQRRRGSELRDAANYINELARRAPNSFSYNWRGVQNALDRINRELGVNGGGGGFGGGGNNGGWGNNNGGGGDRPVVGRVYWRGMVDDRIQLVIKGGTITQRTISGSALADGTFNFTSGLPNRNVNVDVMKSKGRGSVSIVQQPSRANDFTAVIEVRDSGGGAREYELDIFWR